MFQGDSVEKITRLLIPGAVKSFKHFCTSLRLLRMHDVRGGGCKGRGSIIVLLSHQALKRCTQ